MKKNGLPVLLPPNPLPGVINRLMDMGLSEAAGMGVAPLSWLTIEAYQRTMGLDLPPWETKLIRQLSTEYVAESRRAESENCPSPWHSPVTAREREVELANLRGLLG